MSRLAAALGALVLATLPFGAAKAAIVFEFESIATGVYSSVSETVSGLTATIMGQSGTIDVIDVDAFIPGLSNHVLLNTFGGAGPVTANFSAAVDYVSIRGGDFGGDFDTLILRAYSGLNGTGTLLGTRSVGPCCLFEGSDLASLNVNGVRSVQFYTGAGDEFPGSVLFDYLTVGGLSAAVPEPATWTLMIAGFGGVGAMVRRRRAVPA